MTVRDSLRKLFFAEGGVTRAMPLEPGAHVLPAVPWKPEDGLPASAALAPPREDPLGSVAGPPRRRTPPDWEVVCVAWDDFERKQGAMTTDGWQPFAVTFTPVGGHQLWLRRRLDWRDD